MRRYKLSMVLLICLAAAVSVVLEASRLPFRAKAFSGGPDAGRTGAPRELTCATGECHGSQRAIDPLRFTISGPAVYVPGQTYPIVIRQQSEDVTRRRWGFQVTALDASGSQAGTWQSLDASTQIVEESILRRQYAQHTLTGSFAGQGGGASWTINWTAPAREAGPVTFYAAGNQADNNNNSSGDVILLAQTTLLPGQPTPTPTPTPTPPPIPTVMPSSGALLCFNLLTSDAANRWAQDTRVSLTNLHETQSVTVRLLFVNGADGALVNQFLSLRPQRTAVFFAAEVDPGATGYLLALAVDSSSGLPIPFNALFGEAQVRLAEGQAANLAAEAFTLAASVPGTAEATFSLRFDSVQLTPAPRVLALSSLGSYADGEAAFLVLNRLSGALPGAAPLVGVWQGVLYNAQAQAQSFEFPAQACQWRGWLTDAVPLGSIPFTAWLPSGQRGWLKVWLSEDVAVLGAAFKFPAAASVAPERRHGTAHGYNLHKLALTQTATLALPLVPPV